MATEFKLQKYSPFTNMYQATSQPIHCRQLCSPEHNPKPRIHKKSVTMKEPFSRPRCCSFPLRGKLKTGGTNTVLCPFSRKCQIHFLPITDVDIPRTLRPFGIYLPKWSVAYCNRKIYCVQVEMPDIQEIHSDSHVGVHRF